jgi:hypothetical protein
MKKQDYIDAIQAIDSEFKPGTFTVKQLSQHLDALRVDAAAKRESKQAVDADIDKLIETVDALKKTGGAWLADQRAAAIAAMETGSKARTDVQARVWELMKSDLKLVEHQENDWVAKAELKQRPKCQKDGTATAEMHDYYDAPQLLLLREDIVARGDKNDDRFVEGFDKRQHLTTFNTAMRELCKKRNISKIQLQGNEKGGYYIRSYPEVDHVKFEDKPKAEQKHEMREKLEALTSTSELTDNVTFNQALSTVIEAYLLAGKITPNKAIETMTKHCDKLATLADDQQKAA